MANKQLVIEIISDARKFTSGLTEAINTISRASKKAEGFEQYTEQLDEMKETLSLVSQHILEFEKVTQAGGEVSQAQIDSLSSKIESISKRFDSFRHAFGDMQDKLNGLSTQTLQSQIDKVNASLDAFHQKYSSLQQTLNAGLNTNKDFNQISNIGEMKVAYKDALTVLKNFSKEAKGTKGDYSKAYIDAAAAVYKYASALMELDNIYKENNNKALISPNVLKTIENSADVAAKVIGKDLENKLYDSVFNFTDKIDVSSFFKEIQGKVKEQTLAGAFKGGSIIIPVKLDPNAYQNLLSKVTDNVNSLQLEASKKPIKIRYDTDTATLTKNIEKYFKELNTKLKNQVAELNTLMKGLVDDTGLKKTEQDFSSIAKLIPEMLRKVAEYSDQLKTITTDTKTSFENVNNFVKEENFINYANAIKQTAESFKALTSSLDDVSSKLSGNGLEGQFDLLKKKFSELSIDSVLTGEKTKEVEAAKKAKIKEIKELFALYSTYQSRGGIRPFSDLISGETDANKRGYLQLAYSDYNKNKNKKETSTESVPFDAKQLKDILQILKDIRETIKNISEIKIDTSELTEAISAIQGNNNERIFTPQAVSQIWQVLMQYANNYSESLSKVIEKLEIISEKDFEPLKLDSEEFERTYNQIENIVQLLEKGFGISLNPENQLKENIQDITEANQTATESNQKLAESMQEVAQAAQEEKEAVVDPAVKDYLIKWIEMVKGTKAYSGMEERAVFLKRGTPASDIGQGKLSYKNGFVQGQSKIRKYKDAEADTLLHSHQYSKDVDNLRFSFADIKQGMSDIAEGVQNGIHKLLLSCGDEILSLDFGNVSKETASDVQESIRQIYTAAWTMFGGHVFSDGTASERGMSDELRNKASVFINTMLRKMLEEMGGSLTSMKLVDGKMIDTTNTRLNQTITPQQQNLFEQIKKIYALSEDEYEGYRGNLLKKIQKDNGIETNVTGLAGLSKTELEEIDKLLLQIFNHKQQLEKTKTGTRVESTLKEKIAEAEKRIAEITKKPFPSEKSSAQETPSLSFKEDQTQQQVQQTQKTVQQTNNEIENTEQSIITLVSDIKNALNGLSSDLNILAEIIVSLNSSTEQVDYSSRISNIRGGITILNNSIKELAELIRQLDFDKINNIKISTEPFDKIIESLKEIIDLTERISGIPSKTSLDSQFKDIQKIYSSLVNDKGNFIITKDKDTVQNLFSQYNKYKKFGGTKELIDLGESKANANKLSKYYNKYLDDISQQKESEVSITDPLKNETQSFIGIKDAANEAAVSKESFVKANKKLETQTDKTSKSLEQEKTQFETFINDVKTLVTTDIKSNNVVDFNAQILNSSKEVNEVLKEELQYLQKLNEVQKNNPIKQNSTSIISRNTSSKKQDSEKEKISLEKPDSEFDYEDLGLNYDPYVTAFQEFLLIAAEEAEKVRQQIISVSEFDNRLSEALTALYGQIPDLDDISASTGYGKNFNVTSATVSFRDKTTNDIYRKAFSLKKNKETGNFYIDQTTSILNDAEKYGKDNEKQAQQIKTWETQLNAWLQSFNNKTSGTLQNTSNFKTLENFKFNSSKDWIDVKRIQQELEGLYNEIVSNSRRGTPSLAPVPNMMANQENRLTKMQKAKSVYNKMALNWNGGKGAEDTENELKKLSSLYDNLQIEITKFNEDGSNIESVAQAYGAFNEQLNKVNEQLNRMKIVNTEINGNKINNLNNWFKDIPNPEDAQGKIERYSQVYNQFVEAQQRLNELTTNLNRGATEESAQKYEEDKEKIHDIVLELEELKKILSSDSMNINNQMGQVIKQNLPETTDIEQLKKIIDEYADAQGKIQERSQTGLVTDKEGNQFVKFSRVIKDTKGVVSEFEFTYDKAMGTVAVATKKIQEPESAFKALADELTTKWRGLFTTLASFVGFYRLWGYFKQGVNTVREFDAALTEMQKVSDETISTLQDYQKTTFDTADAIGATALQIQNSTADFMRLGESLKEASESAKVANILMNVSEFQSIDEATKSLIAMSAAYDDLSKMNIIDKLNEVGNNYAISTSEAATALQNSASALKTAGNDMDEALALITAGNAVVQDANKVGTGMRTIALRLTGTKSAKDTLEELGEDTDSMLTTQSKLRDTIKEATAVASNNFKGFDILDDNGNYKSTYEIMLGIADIYEEILETDKQFGRNNANLLLESVAGKTRANIAASIFQNPQLLKDAYKSSQEAENSAMEENEKYMDSINGHIAQLQNAYQQLWANSMNRDAVNYFIDLGKSILQVVDNVGLLGTAFIGITGIKSIVGYQNGKGFAYEIIKGSKEAIKYLAANEGAMQSLASKAISAGQAIKGSFSAAIPVIGSVGTAIALVAVAVNAFVEHQRQVRKELLDSTRATGDEWESKKQSLSDYASQYEELKTKLDSGNLSEQETIDVKQQIYDIQKKIIELNGENVSGIDLINNKLQDQLDIISSISQIEADKIWQSKDYQEGFKIAEQAMTEEGSFAISNFIPDYSTSMQKDLSHIIEKYTQHYSVETPELGEIGTTYFVAGDIKDREKRIRAMIKEIEELQKVYSDTRGTIDGDNFFEWSDKYLEELGRGLDIIKETKKESEQIWLSGLNIQLNKEGKGFVLSNYQNAVSNLENAYMMNDTKKIKEATYDYEEAIKIKNEFFESPDNTQFLELFDSIDTSLIETKKRYQDTIDLLKDIPTLDNAKIYKKNTKALKKFTDEENKARKAAERLYKLNPDKIDIRNILENDSHAGGELANALKELMDAMNWTTSDADSLIDALVNAGIVHGDVADAAYSATDAYNQFSQEIATAIENVSKLNTVLTESVSGAGISTQNIDAFKEMFGDDFVYALERSANGYHINAEKLQTLIDKQNALTNSDYQKTLDAQYDALKRCNDEIIKANNEQKDTSGLFAQRQGILQRIQDTQDLMMAYQASTSAFQTWTNAQSNGNEYDMYDKIANGYDTIKDLIDRGWSGDDTVRSYLDLIYGDSFDAFTASGEECAEMFDNLDKKIEGTSFSIHDFFQFDSSGKITSNGIFNFFDALKEKQEQLGLSDSEKWIKDDGTYDFGLGRDRFAAEKLGIDVEFFQSMLRAAVSAGYELNLDQPMWAMDELEKKAIKAQEEIGGFNNIDFSQFNEEFLKSDEAYETLSGHVSDVYDYIQEIENSDELTPDVKTDLIENAQDMLAYLVALEREAADKGNIDLKVEIAENATNSIKQLVEETEKLPKELAEYDWDSITDVEGLEKAKSFIEGLQSSGAIDTSTAETFLNILYEAIDQLDIIDNYEANPTFEGNTVGAFNDVKQARDELKKYIADAQQVEEKYKIKFNFAEDEEVKKLLSTIYGEGTPEILASLDIDPNKTPEEIIEMLELGERDVHVLLETDSSELEKSIQNTNGKTVVTSAVNKQTNSVVNETKNLVTEYTEQITNASMDTSDYDEGLEHVEEGNEEIDKGNPESEAGMDTKDFDKKASDAESKIKTLNSLSATPYVALGGAQQVASAAESIRSQIASIKGKTVSVIANFSSTGLSALKSGIQSAIDKANELASNYKVHLANGTAHARGTAFAKGSIISKHAYAGGKWGLPNDQTALTGELGTEIVVRDGNWFTVGDDGAEFVNLKKGDIVFNHKQAQELLENGYVTSNKGRGHLVGFANGTAYSSGSTSGATRARVATSNSKSSSSRSSGGSGGSGGSSGGNSSSNDAKETKNTLDEVEILIGRIEARISDLDKIIGSTYNTWEDRNDSILDNLKLVTQEISDQRNAYTTYMNKANSINLSESWKQKIRDGAFRIEDVTDSDLWDKIQEYQTWYNKAVASEQALIDLTNKRGELYKQLFDNTQTYYDNMVEAIQHEIDVQDTFIDRLEEAGRLSSKILIYRQYDQEQRKLVKLNEELQTLRQREKDAIDSGYIEYGSEAWSEMESAIADVCAAIEEAESNLVSYDKALNEVDWNRWDRIHDSIDGVVNELEFLYDLINEDDLFTEQGDLTNQGTTALSLLAHEYDVYFAEVQEYQKEIDQVQEDLAKDPYNQILVDKLKELKEAQQDAASGAKKMKESIVDVTEKGIKKQIDYVKKLIEDYEELLETQKDQIDYAKKVADQQKELNRLEKQYRAIQNDDSEETATRRQQLKNQIEEARQNLKETQDDRRLSETKDMLSKFEESFEEFLENKLKDIEGVVREAIDTANTSRGVIKDTINDLASSYGYTPSDTLKSTLDDLSRSFVSYFNGQFENDNVASIADNVNKIVEYYQRVQNQTNQEAAQDTMTEAVRHDGNIQTYRDENGNLISGYFRSDGTRDETYTGWAEKQGRKYRFENGQQLTGAQFIDVDGKRYHLDSNGAVQTGWQKINDQWYYMNGRGEMQTGWQNLNGRWYYLNSQGQMQTGAQQINGKTYVMDESGAMLSGGWNKSNGKWYYLNSDGSAKTGWLKDNNKWYYLNSKGEMQTGAQRVDGKQYVFDGTGAMLSGGWRQYNGKWYYLDSSGVAKTGWIKDNNKWYYLNGQGEMLTGAQRIGNKTYVMDKSGAMLSNGWQYANGKWYYLNSDGSAKTGWQKVDGKWYLLDSQGAMKTGFYSESGKTYYMDGSGAMQTGWQKINGQWYYFNSNGAAASGWAELKYGSATNWYYFDPKTKAMLTNAWIDKSGVTTNPQKGAYYVTSDGTMVKNGRRSTNKGWLTFEKDGKWTGYKTGTSGVGTSGLYWTNEGNKAEAIIRKSDGAILTPLSKGDSVIPNSAMKNMYQALTDPAKYLKQYTTPDVRVIQNSNNSNGQPPVVNMQFIANGVQDANKFVNDLMNNKKLEKWVQEVTLGQANGNNNYKKYSYIVR